MTDINREFDERFPRLWVEYPDRPQLGQVSCENDIKAFYEKKLAVAREEGRKEAAKEIKESVSKIPRARMKLEDGHEYIDTCRLWPCFELASLIRP